MNVINAESGGNLTAQNPTSSAYGIAQFINGPSEYASYSYNGYQGNSTTVMGQMAAMLGYIAQRYGSPCNAWQHEQNFNWYAKGTKSAKPGYAIVGERGPEVVKFSGGEKVYPFKGIFSGMDNA